MSIFYSSMETPIGRIHFVSKDAKLVRLVLPHESEPKDAKLIKNISDNKLHAETHRQLDAYFRGQLKEFSLPLHFEGTPFQIEAWKTLQTIPFGEHRSYKWQATQMRHPKASRAIGQANGRNPLAIIVPCHRVLASSGKLGGYSGGLEIKEFLLNLERKSSH